MIESPEDPDLIALYAYWASKCAGRAMPRRADIDPCEIPALLPHVFIVEIHRSPRLRFRLRLVGSAICQRWGEALTGRWLDELDCDDERGAMLRQYTAIAHSGTPSIDVAEFNSDHGRYLHYWRLLLPLSDAGSDAGDTPAMIFGAHKAIAVDGYRVAGPKWI